MYQTIRNIHLLLASFSVPFLVMYGISAVQMSHNSWFQMKPAVQEREVTLTPGQIDARTIARELMDRDRTIQGELTNIQSNSAGASLRIVMPGTVHDLKYTAASGTTHVKTSVAGVMGMLNRLHHWAGFYHEPPPMKIWALAVAIVSGALLLVGATGIYMWFTRRPERRVGVALLTFNTAFALVIIVLLRRYGP
jgi:hypothetical protein